MNIEEDEIYISQLKSATDKFNKMTANNKLLVCSSICRSSSSSSSSYFVFSFVVAIPLVLFAFYWACHSPVFTLSVTRPSTLLQVVETQSQSQSPLPSASNKSLPSSSSGMENSTFPQPGDNSEMEFKHDKMYISLAKIESRLRKARSSIREASKFRNLTFSRDQDYVLQGPIYRNANAFHRSYMEMERVFKIYVYEEGEQPMFHDGPCKSIYATEGRFIHELERGMHYRTRDPNEALVFFLPFSVVMMVEHLYVPGAHEIHAIGRAILDYTQIIAHKYPFWNRSMAVDHLMLSCHDWGPRATSYVPHLFNNSIRVLCNANKSEGFNPVKDASMPEINLPTGETGGLIGGLSPSRRTILAFFAGRLHGHIRYLLLEQWKDKDKDVLVFDRLPDGTSYNTMLRTSRYCLCPSGYEVASPRIVEAIYAECVPVLISDSYVPPFNDVLNWKSFSVQIPMEDIPNIKKILMGISQSQYLRMQRRVKQVQRHFMTNDPPKRFDVFHMTVHSIWLRRLNVQIKNQ